MSVGDVIKVKMDRLKTLDNEKDVNQTLFNLAVVVLIGSIVYAWHYGVEWFLLGFIVYSFMMYDSVNWHGGRR